MLIFASFLLGTVLCYLFPWFPFLAVLIFITSSVYALKMKKILIIPVIALGIFSAFLRTSPPEEPLSAWNKEIRMTGRFEPKAVKDPYGRRVETFEVETAFDEETGEEVEGLGDGEVTAFAGIEADYDSEYDLVFRASGDRTRLNPGGMTGQRLSGRVVAVGGKKEAACSVRHEFNRYRAGLNEYVLQRFRQEPAALIASVTTGETSYLGDEVREAFNVTGLAHILSISGTHFGLFSLVIFWIFNFMIKRLPYNVLQRLTIYLTPAQAAAILCLPFMAVYLGMSGAGPPAVRSFIMITLFLAGLLLGRKGFWLNSLLFAAFILVLLEPEAVLSLSFQLSFIAVLFIGFALEKDDKDGDDKPEKNNALRFVENSLFLTLAASFGTAPLVAYHFHYLSLISPLSNLIVSPVIGFALVPVSLLASFSFLLTGHYIFSPVVGLAADISVFLVKLMAGIPFADIKIPAFPPGLCILFYAGFIPYLISRKRKVLLLVPLVPFLLYAALHLFDKKELSVTFLDVGQGDSAVIDLPDGRTIVVDTGRTGREAAAFLRYSGKREIEALALTHSDSDHSGGLFHLSERFRVREVWDNGRIIYPDEIQKNINRKALGRGDVVEAGYCRITALHPYKDFYTLYGGEELEENNSSLVLKVSGKKNAFLLTGDVEYEAEENLSQLGTWLRADVIKMPHHGGRSSADSEFLAAVSPSVAVISVGRDNAYGHPSPEVIEKLEGKQTFRTDRDGAIKITERGEGLSIKTYKDFAFERADGPAGELRNMRRLFEVW